MYFCLATEDTKAEETAQIPSKSYAMVCPPVRGYNPRAFASGLSPVQEDKPLYNYFIPPLSVQTLFGIKYFEIKFAISGKSGVRKR